MSASSDNAIDLAEFMLSMRGLPNTAENFDAMMDELLDGPVTLESL